MSTFKETGESWNYWSGHGRWQEKPLQLASIIPDSLSRRQPNSLAVFATMLIARHQLPGSHSFLSARITRMKNSLTFLVAIVAWALGEVPLFSQWQPPETYYQNATGTGSILKTQLESAMTVGHIQASYGDFRFSAAIHDQDPDNPNNIRLVYDGASVNSTWDSGSTWNREHVWPQSRQPGSASNSSIGNLGDPHAVRPSTCLLYTSPSPRDQRGSRMPSSA